MAKLEFSLPTTLGTTKSLSEHSGRVVLLIAESRTHSEINKLFKDQIKAFVEKNASVAKSVDLVAVALLGKEPQILRSVIEKTVGHMAKASGLDCLWLDWSDSLPKKLGVPHQVSAPCYALLDGGGHVIWAAYGQISETQQQKLLSLIKSSI